MKLEQWRGCLRVKFLLYRIWDSATDLLLAFCQYIRFESCRKRFDLRRESLDFESEILLDGVCGRWPNLVVGGAPTQQGTVHG
jgi:hypothetical protein